MINSLVEKLRKIAEGARSEERKVLSAREKDISLSTDKFLNQELVSFLLSEYGYPVLSEESVEKKNYLEYTGHYWIVDPLDGTLNFSRGIPLFCISVALWQADAPVAGIIFDFERDEMFIGVLENQLGLKTGAWCNGSPVEVSGVESCEKAVLSTGFPSWRSYDDGSLLSFTQKVQRWKKVRLLGSAALSLAWVGAGRLDGYIEEDIRIWDIAAGAAIVKAAGGEISVIPGDRENFVTAIATNGILPTDELR